MQVQVQISSQSGFRTESLFVENRVLTFGRAADCSVCLDGQSVSRTHALVQLSEGSMRVEDRSTNGTLLGGEQILRQSAANVPLGTSLQIGTFTVRILPAGAPAAPAPSLPAPGAPAAQSPAVAPAQSADAHREAVELRREIHRLLLSNLDLAALEPSKLHDPSLHPRVVAALRKVVKNLDARIPPHVDRDAFVGELADEALGLGPLERFLADPTVSEIMVVDPETIYVEQHGKLVLANARFTDEERVRAVIERIVTPLGRRIDESSPLVDARLRDGSRVNAVIRPLALRGACITIRKFAKTPLTLEKLTSLGALTPQMGMFLWRSVVAKKNIVISGGTGSGKTTLLNVLSEGIPPGERIVTIEDAAELRLKQPHVVSLETRPANMEGKGEYTIRDLVKNALRMRPDRIVVGECRGGEALDMLQAMNTGHAGSLTTTHANSPREAVARLETLVLMAGLDLPVRAIREQIAGAIDLLVQQTRLPDGSRKVTEISEVVGLDDDGDIELLPLFEFVRTGTGPQGKVCGEFRSTGFLPTFLHEFVVGGLIQPGEAFL
jgi:pilus assembly protein CpaF